MMMIMMMISEILHHTLYLGQQTRSTDTVITSTDSITRSTDTATCKYFLHTINEQVSYSLTVLTFVLFLNYQELAFTVYLTNNKCLNQVNHRITQVWSSYEWECISQRPKAWMNKGYTKINLHVTEILNSILTQLTSNNFFYKMQGVFLLIEFQGCATPQLFF